MKYAFMTTISECIAFTIDFKKKSNTNCCGWYVGTEKTRECIGMSRFNSHKCPNGLMVSFPISIPVLFHHLHTKRSLPVSRCEFRFSPSFSLSLFPVPCSLFHVSYTLFPILNTRIPYPFYPDIEAFY